MNTYVHTSIFMCKCEFMCVYVYIRVCVCVCVYMYENCVNICLNIYIHIHSIFTSIIMYVHMYKYFVGNRNCNIFNYTTLPMQLLSTVILEPTNPEPQSYKTKKQNRTYTKKPGLLIFNH